MRIEQLMVKVKQDKSMKLFTTTVKRWFFFDQEAGTFGYS